MIICQEGVLVIKGQEGVLVTWSRGCDSDSISRRCVIPGWGYRRG